MAQVNPNSLFSGISGRIGNIVFRQLRGKTIVQSRPEKRALPASEKQQADKAGLNLHLYMPPLF